MSLEYYLENFGGKITEDQRKELEDEDSWVSVLFKLVLEGDIDNHLMYEFLVWLTDNMPPKDVLEDFTINLNEGFLYVDLNDIITYCYDNDNIDYFYKLKFFGLEKVQCIDGNLFEFLVKYKIWIEDEDDLEGFYSLSEAIKHISLRNIRGYEICNEDYVKKWFLNYYFIENLERLEKILLIWKEKPPSKKVLDDFKEIINDTHEIWYSHDGGRSDDSCNVNLLELVIYNHLDNIMMRSEQGYPEVYCDKKLIELLIYFGAKLKSYNWEKTIKELTDFDAYVKRLKAGQKIAVFVKDALDDSEDFKPMRARMDMGNIRELESAAAAISLSDDKE